MIDKLLDIDGNILLWIQDNIRNDILTPIVKFITSLGNAGMIWIAITLILLIFKKTRKEEYLNIDETLAELERSSSIIRLEMNSIELPLFSKDSRRVKDQIKVYHFKTDGSSYLEIEAPAGYSIPGEFEERVFIALTKIMKKHNYSRKFVVSANEILENLNVTNPIYFKKLKTAMELLAKTNYTFMNSLYSKIGRAHV